VTAITTRIYCTKEKVPTGVFSVKNEFTSSQTHKVLRNESISDYLSSGHHKGAGDVCQ